MNWIMLLLVFVILFLILKNFKHHMFLKMLKVFMILVMFVLILLVVSHYVDIGEFFNKDNAISKTGATVVETVRNNPGLAYSMGKKA
ncbi:MAG: hypothetical protein AABY09_02870, partial [Nanoarchaeota archaeon]